MTRDRPSHEHRYLRYIRESIDRIESYRPGGLDDYLEDAEAQDAISWRLQAISDAARNHLSDGLKQRHPEIPWRAVYGFRNVAAHGYADLNLTLVWEIIAEHLSALADVVDAELATRAPGPRADRPPTPGRADPPRRM